MAFTLNSGEVDLGAGFIGRGTILAGESYVEGTSTTGVQGLLNTSGLEGLASNANNGWGNGTFILFKPSNDVNPATPTFNSNINAFFVHSFDSAFINSNVRFGFMTNWTGDYNRTYSTINSNSLSKSFIVDNKGSLTAFNNSYIYATNWRFLARDHATALIHYPSTLEEGSVFAASCVNSPTQWGLWIAGEVGDRSGYFNQTQGYFAIVILRNGSTWYISAFTPAAANSTSRNDNVIRSFNIVPAPGQTGADRFSELFIARDLGNGLSETIGKVPGFIYVDMNQAANSALYVGSLLEITPGVGTSYELLNNGAIVVAQWGLDISATTSNVGSTFTIDTASTPSLASLSSLNRTRTTLEENQRIQITATPPTGLSTATNYWVKNWNPTAFTFNLAATEGGAAIVPSNNTNSTITRYAGLIAMPCYRA